MQDHSLPAWARDATLGIFIHWGAYSVPAWAEPTGVWGAIPPEEWFAHNAYAEWYANTIRIDGSPASQHHFAEFGGIPYVELLDIWRAESFDPLDWGLGVQLNTRPTSWMGMRASPRTFGHFGGAGTFLWVDPEAHVACVVLTTREFGEWAKETWPRFSDALLDEIVVRE